MTTTNGHAAANVIDLDNVEKTYRGGVRALRGVAMRVRRGEVFGLLGPNGAGKSTLVKILMTVIRPSLCTGTMLGNPIGDKATLATIGYLPEHHRFPDHLKGAQVLDFYGAMAGVPRRERLQRRDALLELVDMTAWAKTPIKRYSKGMRQRIGIAQALMNDPSLVLLDEPTDGVDPQGRRDIRDICTRLRDEGRTVLINSHLLSELEAVCDRVAILVQGLVRSQGTLEELTSGQRSYHVDLFGAPGDARTLIRDSLRAAFGESLSLGDGDDAKGSINGRAGGASIEWRPSGVALGSDDPALVQPLLRELVSRGAVIETVARRRPSLEDLFMQAVTDSETGETLAPGAAAAGKKAHGKKATP